MENNESAQTEKHEDERAILRTKQYYCIQIDKIKSNY